MTATKTVHTDRAARGRAHGRHRRADLRISERSVSTIMRSLMDRFGVDNRFQLGLALGVLNAAPYPPRLAARRSDPQE